MSRRRPRAEWISDDGPRILPIPWIAEDADKPGELTPLGWTSFDQDHAREGHARRLCQVCGEQVTGVLVHLNATSQGRLYTSGCGMHSRCAWMAIKMCPHFGRSGWISEYIGWIWDGPGQGYDVGAEEDDPTYWDSVLSDILPPLSGAYPITVDDLRQLARGGVYSES